MPAAFKIVPFRWSFRIADEQKAENKIMHFPCCMPSTFLLQYSGFSLLLMRGGKVWIFFSAKYVETS